MLPCEAVQIYPERLQEDALLPMPTFVSFCSWLSNLCKD